MSSDFDPYRVWLSIPANEQPANYYRLLGVELFESDDEVIISAADRQITHVSTFQSGQYSEQAQRILRELATAQVTLLNKSKKVKYDAQLRSKLNASTDSKIDDTIVVELPPPPPQPSSTPSSKKSKVKHKKQKAVKTIKKNADASLAPFIVVLLSAMVLEMFVFLSFFLIYQNKLPARAEVYQIKAKELYDQSIELEKEKKYPEALIKLNAVCELVPENEDYKSARQRVQTVIEKAQLLAGTRKKVTVNGVEFAFRWCPAGTFTMGSPESEEGHTDKEIQHEVTLSEGFWMMETEVTQQQWKAVMGNNPSKFQGDTLPVEHVSWDDCQIFCNKCQELGLPVQIPTEAQLEYACRAGTTGTFSGNLDDMGWNLSNADRKTHPVGMKAPNAWGLYDIHGNVWEWSQDKLAKYPEGSVTDPVELFNGSSRVVRGGSWLNDYTGCRSACRGYFSQKSRVDIVGLRCVIPGNSEFASLTTQDSDSTDKNKETEIQNNNNDTIAGTREAIDINGVEFAFRWCPPGSFMMGSPESEEGRISDETYHQVTLTKGFWMMETEVTQKQWKAVMGSEPATHFKGDNLPVECVSLEACLEFCQKCSSLGLPLQLPTESQWEYACRAGTTEAYIGVLDEIAWHGSNSEDKTHPVGTKKPNAWGLFDMTGNVWERCRDLRAVYPSESVTDPEESSNGFYRAVRGGGLFSRPSYCRAACRGDDGPGCREQGLGFRCIKSQ